MRWCWLTGELQPLGAERPLKAPFAGMVKEILVTEGQDVVAGQALIRMDTEVSEKRKETLERQYELEENRFTEETRSFRARGAKLAGADGWPFKGSGY